MPKVHKTPLKLRPVISCINSYSSIFSTWLDFKMKELLQLFPSYIKNSTDLIKDLKAINLPKNAKLFTADASSMYTNIDTASGLQAFNNIFSTYENRISPTFPREFFLTVLELVMNNNLFTFGDSYWIQLQGTAMGTPAAPLYSIITYGFHENTRILNQYSSNLLYYKRYIDDIFGIWVDTPVNTWDNFKSDLDSFGLLRWNVENLTHSTTFLDLQIEISQGTIVTRTFQKELNLYLYIPPLSAHPHSCFKGFITGEIIRYWTQNSKTEDFISITTQFLNRLQLRGHCINELIPILQCAAASLDNKETASIRHKAKLQTKDTAFLHWVYHPKDITKNTLRNIYNNSLRGHDNFKDMRIAMSRPKNLKDILCKSSLPDVPGMNPSDFLT